MQLRVWLMLIICCGSALAQTTANSKAADSKNNSVITGRVIGEDGQPLAGVSVQAQSRTGVARTVLTAEDGSFRLTRLSAANYRLSASLPAFVMLPLTGEAGEPKFFRDGDSVTMTLVKGGVITGRVTDSNGQPIPGLQISAQRVRNAEGKLLNNFGYTRRTDDRGIYRIFGLPSGTYVVRTEGFDSGWSWSADEQANDATIYYPSSSPDAATELTVQPGIELNNIDINYRAEPGHKVSGKVSGTTSGLYFMVYLRLPGSGETMYESFRGISSAKLENGVGFEIRGVADGEYELSAERTNGDDDGAASATHRISVRGSDLSGLDLQLTPLASVVGKVQLEDTKEPACAGLRGGKLEDAVVVLSPEIPRAPQSQSMRVDPKFSAVTREGGLKLPYLFPARYRFNVQLPSASWYLRSIQQSDTGSTRKFDLARDGLTIASGSKIKDVTITLSTGAASLSGKIKPAPDQKLPDNLRVYLLPAEMASAEDVLRHVETISSESGAFEFRHLPPGKYWLLSKTSGVNAVLVFDAAERLKLRREAEAANIAVELKPCQRQKDFDVIHRP
ncbi:MAG TPA: carboxypeptidase-like regulatory domain-containing protein [Blastocatellia bacterium]|nr:carboxypeptidase-like regulatory domain-containing protein [Blastocatellia bacterium]